MDYKGQERRKHPRIPIGARVTVSGADSPDYLFTLDLSIGGVGLATENQPPLRTILKLELGIMGVAEIIEVEGEVVRHFDKPEKGFGVSFTKFKGDSKSLLEKALQEMVGED